MAHIALQNLKEFRAELGHEFDPSAFENAMLIIHNFKITEWISSKFALFHRSR